MHSVLRVWRGGRAGRGAGISPERDSPVAVGELNAGCGTGLGGPPGGADGRSEPLADSHPSALGAE